MKKLRKTRTYQSGLRAENYAAFYLRLKGYRILKRRFKTPVGEIDLIAIKNKTLIAVEVKSRMRDRDGLEAVTIKNRQRVTRAFEYYLNLYPVPAHYTLRFDVVIYRPPFHFQHMDNAWETGS